MEHLTSLITILSLFTMSCSENNKEVKGTPQTEKHTVWLFDQAPNVAAITSTHITKRGLPILQVTHYEDDHSWGFQSGLAVRLADGQVVAMKEIIKLDHTVVEIADLPPGWSAKRKTVGGEWKRSKDEWSDDGD